jgi:FdhD protein
MNESAGKIGATGWSEADIVKFDTAHPAGYARRATVIEERPLQIRVDNSSYTLLRTPGHDRELVVGFCYTEGLIRGISDVLLLGQCPDSEDAINVRTVGGGGERPQRSLIITSSCGMCGVENLDAMLGNLGRVDTRLTVPVACLYKVSDAVRASQHLFGLTGGTHAAAAFGADGAILGVQEDVGRHNALDKLIGHVLLRGHTLGTGGVFLSGRTSLEMVAKAVRAGIPLLVSVGAPTSLAIALAERAGITLCGFLRREEISIYTHTWRIAA